MICSSVNLLGFILDLQWSSFAQVDLRRSWFKLRVPGHGRFTQSVFNNSVSGRTKAPARVVMLSCLVEIISTPAALSS